MKYTGAEVAKAVGGNAAAGAISAASGAKWSAEYEELFRNIVSPEEVPYFQEAYDRIDSLIDDVSSEAMNEAKYDVGKLIKELDLTTDVYNELHPISSHHYTYTSIFFLLQIQSASRYSVQYILRYSIPLLQVVCFRKARNFSNKNPRDATHRM